MGNAYCSTGSVDFDTTENLYIEGDNLEVLKLLQETYLGRIKMIYIDPPYNTGSDLVYEDDFAQSADEYFANSGQFDEEGNRLVANTENNGRFHTDWLNMIYPRLRIAKDLLRDDGVIFISIDNHEVDNMLKICDEIFGLVNRIACVVNVNNPKGRSDEKNIATAHEYIAVYQKKEAFLYGFAPEENVTKRYNKVDSNGRLYRHIDLRKTGDSDRRVDRPKMFYYFYYNPNTGEFYPSYDENGPEEWIKIIPMKDDGSEGRWRVGIDTAIERSSQLEPTYMTVKKRWTVMEMDYLSDDLRVKATTAWAYKDLNSERGTEQFVELGFEKNVFPRPKPIGTVLRPLILSTKKDDIILDFFSGSATIAQAVMQLNAEDGGNRKFIAVQLPEVTNEKSEAHKAGYKNICEIGKERIRRAGAKIKEDSPLTTTGLDVGFRVLKCDTSNMKEVFYKPDEVEQTFFDNYANNIKEDRTPEDLLFQVMLDLGVLLSSKIEETTIAGCKVFNVAEGFLYACFDNNISDEVVTAIAKEQPYYAVFRDSGMASDSVLTNFDQIFASISPSTVRKVL